MNHAFARAALSCRRQQPPAQISKLALPRIIRARQVRHVIGVKQAGGVTRRDGPEGVGIGLETGVYLTLGQNLIQHGLPFRLHCLTGAGRFTRRVERLCDLVQPIRRLAQIAIIGPDHFERLLQAGA